MGNLPVKGADQEQWRHRALLANCRTSFQPRIYRQHSNRIALVTDLSTALVHFRFPADFTGTLEPQATACHGKTIWTLVSTGDSKQFKSVLFEGEFPQNPSFQITVKMKTKVRSKVQLPLKTIAPLRGSILLVGGCQHSQDGLYTRDDYLLCTLGKDKKLFRRRLSSEACLEQAGPFVVQLTQRDYLAYSLASLPVKGLIAVRISTLRDDTTSKQDKIVCCVMACQMSQPKIAKIIRYTSFNVKDLQRKLELILDRLKDFSIDLYTQLQTGCTNSDRSSLQLALKSLAERLMAFDHSLLVVQDLVAEVRSAYSFLNKLYIQQTLPIDPAKQELYFFIVEDEACDRVKYLAIEQLNEPCIQFVKASFKWSNVSISQDHSACNLFSHGSAPIPDQLQLFPLKSKSMHVETRSIDVSHMMLTNPAEISQ